MAERDSTFHVKHHHRQNKNKIPHDPLIQARVEFLFNKTFTYPGNNLTICSAPDVEFTGSEWSVPELQLLKTHLNNIKSELSGLEIREWHTHTSQLHAGGLVSAEIRKRFRPELCTQAWCKFREVISHYELLRLDQDVNTVHLCEAPGAFIASLNHYLYNAEYHGHWTWLGTTLNPYYEENSRSAMINDDHFIFETLDNWYFGRDDTGDIMSVENIQGLKERCQLMKHVSLVTADGGIDCANNPGEQESLTAPLHYCELVAALQILSPGGSIVLKMFTLLEDTSVSLMYLLHTSFDKLHVIKPVTSKAGNSEVYVVAQGFHGLPDSFLTQMLNNIGSERRRFSKDSMPQNFIESHIQCCQLLVNWQINTIQLNLDLLDLSVVAKKASENADQGQKEETAIHKENKNNSSLNGCNDIPLPKRFCDSLELEENQEKNQRCDTSQGSTPSNTERLSIELEGTLGDTDEFAKNSQNSVGEECVHPSNCEQSNITVPQHSKDTTKDMTLDLADLKNRERLKKACVTEYLSRYKVRPIALENKILPDYNKLYTRRQKSHCPTTRVNTHQGSYEQRQQQNHMTWSQQVQQMTLFAAKETAATGTWLHHPAVIRDEDISSWQPVCGRPVSHILMSRFCELELLDNYQYLLVNHKHEDKDPTESYGEMITSAAAGVMNLVSRTGRGIDVVPCEVSTTDRLAVSLKAGLHQIQISRGTEALPCTGPLHRLHCLDVYSTTLSEQRWLCTQRVLASLLHVLTTHVLGERDHLVVVSPPPLTRLAAATIFFLHHCFKKVSVHVPSDSSHPVCFLVAFGYHSPRPILQCYFYNILRKLNVESETESTLNSKSTKTQLNSNMHIKTCHSNQTESVSAMIERGLTKENCGTSVSPSIEVIGSKPEQVTSGSRIDLGEAESLGNNLSDEGHRGRLSQRELEVLAVVPIQLLCEMKLHKVLWESNNLYLKRRINHFVRREKHHLEQCGSS